VKVSRKRGRERLLQVLCSALTLKPASRPHRAQYHAAPYKHVVADLAPIMGKVDVMT
jgi:predicted secreted protein